MFDSSLRPIIDPPLNRAGRILVQCGITSNSVTLFGLLMGLIAMALILQQAYVAASCFIVLNRICDGLDGAVARASSLTDFGGFLDIVCDFIVYAGVPFAFGLAEPAAAPWCLFLMFSYFGPGISFLAYAILAEKRKKTTIARGHKSFYYIGGLCEGTETFAVMILLCIMPGYIPVICGVYGAMCWLTTLARILQAKAEFS